MAFQRSFATIYERISRVFKDKRIRPNEINTYFKGMYPRTSFSPVDYSIAVDAIIGMVQFLDRDAESWELEQMDDITFISIINDICKIDLANDISVCIYNFNYVTTATIEVRRYKEIINVTGLNYNKMSVYIDKAASILIDELTSLYIRRWSRRG